MQPNGEFHILANGFGIVPAHLQEDIAAVNPEGTRNDEQRAQLIPSHPAKQKSPQILDGLEAHQRFGAEARFHHLAVFNY